MTKIGVALLLAVLMVYGIAAVSAEWLDVIVEIDGQVLEPVMSFLAICFVVAICVAIGFFVTVSLVGVVVFAIAAAILGVVFAGISVFWPVLLVLFVIYLFTRSSGKTRHAA